MSGHHCWVCETDDNSELWERGHNFMCISCAERFDELKNKKRDEKLLKLIDEEAIL